MVYVNQYPLVLGRWEDQTTFPMMLSRAGPRPSFELYQAGEIGGDHYALLSMGYYTADLLGWSLVTLRLPAIVGGLAALATFFGLTARWYGFWPALFTAFALGFNPTFFMFSHQLIVPIISMLFLLLVIERYQLIEQGRHLRWTVPTLALAFTLLLEQYAVGRVYGCAMVVYWMAWLIGSSIRARRKGVPVDRKAWLAFPAFVALVVVFSVVLDPSNARQLTLQLLFPPDGEYVVVSAEQLALVRDNLAVELNAIVPLLTVAPGRLGQFSSDLVVDVRTYVLPMSMVPLVVLGAAVVLAQLRRRSSARLSVFLLVVLFAGPLLSANVGGHLSISSFRMFYLLIPLYLLAAAAMARLIHHRERAMQLAACGVMLLVLTAQVASAVREIDRHNVFLEDLARRWQPSSPLTLFRDNGAQRATPQFELATNGSYQYYFLQLAPLAAAVRILDRAPIGATDADVVVVRLLGPVQSGKSGGATRVVFYLRSFGASAALFDPMDQSVRGAGVIPFAPPAYVVADGPGSAATAVSLLRQAGRQVRVVDFEWSS